MTGASAWLVAPYAAWMALMALLPPSAGAYAVRTAAVAAVLAVACRRLRLRPSFVRPVAGLLVPVLVGFLVFAVWVLPEQFGWTWYSRWCIVGEGGTRAIAEASAAMVFVRLVGSAFVISVAEEMFFRRWLIGFAGLWWSVALFAVEHDRWLVGAVAGLVYALLYLRRGLFASVVAHATTNLALGLWVLRTGQWQFW